MIIVSEKQCNSIEGTRNNEYCNGTNMGQYKMRQNLMLYLGMGSKGEGCQGLCQDLG